jgi:glycosyltransferase involved in cell wall biosynthesis
MTPKVSIILTSYNHEFFLRESIDSVLSQTYPDFELFIFDDQSTDTSWEIINSYHDKRIQAFQNPTNFGTCYIKDAIGDIYSGEFIGIHHSDDIWEPNKLEKQITYLEKHQEFAAIFTRARIINEKGEDFMDSDHFYFSVFNQPNRTRHEWLRHFFLKGNLLCNPSVIIRKAPFNQLRTIKGLYQLSDLSLWVQICLAFDIHILQEKLVRFRVRDNEANMSGNKPDSRIRHRYEMMKILDLYRNIPSPDDLVAIFPEAQKHLHPENRDVLYALGRVALEVSEEKPVRLFGLNLLFEAINNDSRAQALEIYQQFNLKSFMNLTGKMDLFSIEKINTLKEDLSKLKDHELFYSESRSWRLTEPLRKLMLLFRKTFGKKK